MHHRQNVGLIILAYLTRSYDDLQGSTEQQGKMLKECWTMKLTEIWLGELA